MKLKKPSLYRSLPIKYAKSCVSSSLLKKFNFEDKWPCFNCCGSGYRIESSGYYDSEKVRCAYCNDGVISRLNFYTYFEPIHKRYLEDLAKYRKIKSEFDAAKKKLTRKEYILLITYGEV